MPELYSADDNSSKKQKPKKKAKASKPEPIDSSFVESFRTRNPLSSFAYKPENIKFETQEEQEKVVLLLRQHPIVNLPWIFVAVILVFAPSILSFFPLIDFLPLRFQFVAVLFWYLITLAYVLESALSWFFNVYIVTDERVIDVDFENLLYREVSETNLDKIQDVEYRAGGIGSTIFNYGDIFIQTAGTEQNFEFKAVPKPAETVRVIRVLQEAYLKNNGMTGV